MCRAELIGHGMRGVCSGWKGPRRAATNRDMGIAVSLLWWMSLRVEWDMQKQRTRRMYPLESRYCALCSAICRLTILEFLQRI